MDVLIHQYDSVLSDIVWESTQNDVQPLRLRRQCKRC
jgi:uncharacterized protein with HEPN domain